MPDTVLTQENSGGILELLRSQEARSVKLEDESQKTFWKRMTTSASTSALFLGLVLTFASLFDTFVSKPEADRISRISQFNQAVNAAAKTRQEILQSSQDPKLQVAIQSEAVPQILNDLSTARAMLRDLATDDVGIPQLTILISEAFTAGDIVAAKEFVARAVSKTDATPYLRSEAKRYEGRLYFLTGDPVRGWQSYQDALSALGDSQFVMAARAYDLGDLVLIEYPTGACEHAETDLKRFVETVRGPDVPQQARLQLLAVVRSQLGQTQGPRCPFPENLPTLLAD
jgi:hypothetical protein